MTELFPSGHSAPQLRKTFFRKTHAIRILEDQIPNTGEAPLNGSAVSTNHYTFQKLSEQKR